MWSGMVSASMTSAPCSAAASRTTSSSRGQLPTLWTNAYFVATVGGAPHSIIKQYVENQRNV
jgi:REP element-mobilizing transposase RayT